jgi:methionine-rich copper-binding protein CopC
VIRRPATVLLGVLVAVGSVLLTSATPAAAHAELRAQYPAPGAALDGSPRDITLEFSKPVTLVADSLLVHLRDQVVALQDVALEADGHIVRGTFRSPLAGGDYRISWRVIAGDDHVLEGAFDFTIAGAVAPVAPPAPQAELVAAPATAPATPAAPERDRTAAPLLFGLAAAVVAVALTVLSARRAATRTRPLEGIPA